MITVYTANINGYDNIQDPTTIEEDIQYYCLTNKDLTSNTYQIIQSGLWNRDPQRTARKYKIDFANHVETDISIWHDSSFKIVGSMHKLLQQLEGVDMVVVQHAGRNCIYDEAAACIAIAKGNREEIEAQVAAYRKEGYPKYGGGHNNLIESGVLVRRDNKRVRDVCKIWWEQVQRHSPRDQISFNYAVWKAGNGIKIRYITWAMRNEYFELNPHNYTL